MRAFPLYYIVSNLWSYSFLILYLYFLLYYVSFLLYKKLKCFSFFFSLSLYLQGFTLEDATGLAIKGEVDIHSVYATSLPASHPSFSPQRALEMLEKWKARPLPKSPIQVFIGVLSATNHFAERMAVRKTWMQSSAVKSSRVVVRFFVALVRIFLSAFCQLTYCHDL